MNHIPRCRTGITEETQAEKKPNILSWKINSNTLLLQALLIHYLWILSSIVHSCLVHMVWVLGWFLSSVSQMIAKKQEKGKKATHFNNIFPKQNQPKRYFGAEGPDRGACLQHHFTSSFHLEDSLAPSRYLSVAKTSRTDSILCCSASGIPKHAH